MRSNAVFVLLVLPVSLLLWGCTPEEPPGGGGSTGETLFSSNCSGASCHGFDGSDGPYQSIRNRNASEIRNGLNGFHFGQFSLTDNDINAIIEYLNSTLRLSNSTWIQGIILSTQAVSGELMIKDVSGASSSGTIDPTSGAFAIDVSALTAPYVLQFSTAQDGGTLYSFASEPGIANITPITDMVVREVSAKGDIDQQFNDCSELDANCFTALSGQSIADTKSLVNTRLASEMEQVGIDPNQFDAMTTPIDEQQIDLLQILEANGVID